MFDVVIGEFMDATTVETLESLLSRSDGVTEAIASLHPGSVLINTARINTARNVSRVLEENA
ncbi:hypothetical protein [Salinicola lusitanus]|uniref:hypothetical protein n=1 Tax=Salinicola lusitanus TaxID=1949085 RepID=UPI000DA1F850|nr:hypothetical protein [Salinicola lusitanus]